MPPKVRELIARLEKAGFTDVGGKGSHRNFKHKSLTRRVTISGNPGEDARPYQVKDAREAIEDLSK